MARPRRLEFAGGLYHVMARGNERKAVFRDDADRERYLERLEIYRERFGFHFLAFCLMDNHVHLVVETGRVSLSRIMQGLQSSYTQAFNRRYGRVGHLFQGRYKAFLVDGDRYFVALLRYVHRNPVEAGLVDRAERYRWSSDRYYRKGKGPEWMDVGRGLSYLTEGRSEAVRRYRRLMLMGEGPEEGYERVSSVAQLVKGDEVFARRVLERAGEPELVQRSLRVETVARRVAESRGLQFSHLRGQGRTREVSLARAMTGYLGKSLGRIPFVRTAEYLNRDGSTLTRDVRHLEALLQRSPALRKELNRITERLQQ